MSECPACGDILLGYSVREAMEHLSICDEPRGWMVAGVKPANADQLYENITGNERPNMEQFERMVHYFNMEERELGR